MNKSLPVPDEGDSSPEQHAPTLDTNAAASGPWVDAQALLPSVPLECVGSLIGPYKLLQQIGEGGMGVVFMAEQQQPVRRMVALKVIKAGMDSRQIVARFEAERQALALMDHPNIARVLEAGTTTSGRPYFVMELVKGIPITRYCDEQRLTLRQRLELFIPVCQAIQHAHQKGIIHRDIKPSNVLIAAYDGQPVPKVIDFGVAKAMGGKLTERTLFTGFGGIVGTLEYMSPEQAEFNALDIDTRSDVYSLGVLLYELLTGTTPLMRRRLQDSSLLEVLRLIREEEAPRPSTRLSATKDSLAAVSAQRQMEPAALLKALRGEVEWIVMKALEKDRGRRYETANALGRDIQRYLAEEPLEAGPPSTAYRFRKLAWKHRRSLGMAASLLLLLVAGVVVSTSLAVWALRAEGEARTAEQTARDDRDLAIAAEQKAIQAEKDAQSAKQTAIKERDRAKEAEQKAKHSEKEAKDVLEFFQDKVLSAVRPEEQEGGLGKDVTLQKAVDAAEPAVAKTFADRPLVEASIRNTLGETYYYLGKYPRAVEQHKRALALREAKLGIDHLDTLLSRDNLGQVCVSAGLVPDAIRLHQQNLKLREAKLGADHLDTINSRDHLALAYQEDGRCAEAIPMHEQDLQQIESRLGVDHPATHAVRNNLANAYVGDNRAAKAIPLFLRNLKLYETRLGADHPDTLGARNNLANAYLQVNRGADAIPLLVQALQQKEAKLGLDHPDTLASRHNLANTYRTLGRTADAIRLHRQNFQLCEAKLGAKHDHTLISGDQLAATYDQAGEFAKAETLYRQLLDRTRKSRGAEHPRTANSMAALGTNLLRQHKHTEAEPLLRDCLKIREAKLPDVWVTFNTRSLLGEALWGQKKYTDAEPLLLSGYEGMKARKSQIPLRSKALSEALERLVRLYETTGKKDEAAKWRREQEQAHQADAKDASKK